MLRVLIVDDHPGVANAAALVVVNLGYQADTCHLPLEALTRLQIKPFDLLITDYGMPDLNGLDFVQRLRKQGCLIPVVMMLGQVNRIDLHRVESLGISPLLSKPFTLSGLAQALRKALEPKQEHNDSDLCQDVTRHTTLPRICFPAPQTQSGNNIRPFPTKPIKDKKLISIKRTKFCFQYPVLTNCDRSVTKIFNIVSISSNHCRQS